MPEKPKRAGANGAPTDSKGDIESSTQHADPLGRLRQQLRQGRRQQVHHFDAAILAVDAPAGVKMVYMAMESFAGAERELFPEIDTIAAYASIGRTLTKDALRWFESLGVIASRRSRGKDGGGRTSDLIRLAPRDQLAPLLDGANWAEWLAADRKARAERAERRSTAKKIKRSPRDPSNSRHATVRTGTPRPFEQSPGDQEGGPSEGRPSEEEQEAMMVLSEADSGRSTSAAGLTVGDNPNPDSREPYHTTVIELDLVEQLRAELLRSGERPESLAMFADEGQLQRCVDEVVAIYEYEVVVETIRLAAERTREEPALPPVALLSLAAEAFDLVADR